MIKKSIASFLIALLIVNSIGCFPYKEVRTDEKDKIEKGGNVKIIKMDNKRHLFTNVVFQDSILVGTERIDNWEKQVKVPVKDIKTIEVQKFEPASLLLLIIPLGFGIAVASLPRW